jgi:hypothetical protein
MKGWSGQPNLTRSARAGSEQLPVFRDTGVDLAIRRAQPM